MSKRTGRKVYKEELKRAVGNCEWASTHLARFVDAYSGPHPELALKAVEIIKGLGYTIAAINKLNEQI